MYLEAEVQDGEVEMQMNAKEEERMGKRYRE